MSQHARENPEEYERREKAHKPAPWPKHSDTPPTPPASPSAEDYAREPRIHSHIEDCLPENHPLAFKQVSCDSKRPDGSWLHDELLHAANNECMQTWVETGEGNYCWACASKKLESVLWNGLALGQDPATAALRERVAALEAEAKASYDERCDVQRVLNTVSLRGQLQGSITSVSQLAEYAAALDTKLAAAETRASRLSDALRPFSEHALKHGASTLVGRNGAVITQQQWLEATAALTASGASEKSP